MSQLFKPPGALEVYVKYISCYPSPSRPGSWFGWPCSGGAEVSKAPVRCHTLWQPAPPGTVRPIFPCGRLACLASCELRFPAWAKSGSWRSFLRGSIPRAGVDLGDPSHRGRKNHMDRSMLCRRRQCVSSLRNILGSYRDTSVCKATHRT